MPIIPDYSRKTYDIIVYGASGFTGRRVSKYLHEQEGKRAKEAAAIASTLAASDKNEKSAANAAPPLVDNNNSTPSTAASASTSFTRSLKPLKWAISGRSHTKLSGLMQELVSMGISESPLPDMLVADVNEPRTLEETFAEARLVLNCTGPYRFLGKDIVAACIEGGANYMDLCGEPQFMEQMFYDLHDSAMEKKLLIVHACAFDSVPADLGCYYVQSQFLPQHCSSIESFLTLNSPAGLKGHKTTYECAVHGMGDVSKLRRLRKDSEAKYKVPKINFVGEKVSLGASTYYWEPRVNKYAIPFMGADVSVVRSGHRTMAMRTGQCCWPQYNAYATVDNFYWVATTAIYGGVFSTLAKFSLGRSLLLSSPEFFSNDIFTEKGPNEQQLESTTFEMHFFARGYSTLEEKSEDTVDAANNETADKGNVEPNQNELDKEDGAIFADMPSPTTSTTSNKKRSKKEKISAKDIQGTSIGSNTCAIIFGDSSDNKNKNRDSNSQSSNDINGRKDGSRPLDKFVEVVVSGPEPGYVATPAIFITLAYCLLDERSHLPEGGVLTPASAFCNSPTVFQRLERSGIKFTVKQSLQH